MSEAASTPSRHVSSTPQMLLTALPTVSESPEVIVSSFINSICGFFTSYILQATIHYYRVTPTKRRICKSLVRRNYQSFAKKCVQNVVSRKALVKIVGRTLTKEVAAMCSKKFNSILF